MRKRTVSAILVWLAILVLILNGYLRSSWVVVLGIGLVVSAIVIYFLPRKAQ